MDMGDVALLIQEHENECAVFELKFGSVLGKHIQLYPKSLEPKKGSGQGKDFILLITLAHSLPNAKTLYDLGVRSNTHLPSLLLVSHLSMKCKAKRRNVDKQTDFLLSI